MQRRKALLGDPRGQSPLASLTESKSREAFPMEWCVMACHNAKLALLLQCDLEAWAVALGVVSGLGPVSRVGA